LYDTSGKQQSVTAKMVGPMDRHAYTMWKFEKRDSKARQLEEAEEEIKRLKGEIPSPPSAKEETKYEIVNKAKKVSRVVASGSGRSGKSHGCDNSKKHRMESGSESDISSSAGSHHRLTKRQRNKNQIDTLDSTRTSKSSSSGYPNLPGQQSSVSMATTTKASKAKPFGSSRIADNASERSTTPSTVRRPGAMASQSPNVGTLTGGGLLFKKDLGFKPYDGPPMSDDSVSDDDESTNDTTKKTPPAEATDSGNKKHSSNDNIIDSSDQSDGEESSWKATRKKALDNDIMIDSSPSPARTLHRDTTKPHKTVESKVLSSTTKENSQQEVKPKRPRNPLQVQQLEDERDKKLRQNAFRKAAVNNDDALWDSDGEDATISTTTRRQVPCLTSPASPAPRKTPLRRVIRSKRRGDLGDSEDRDARNIRENATRSLSPSRKSVHNDDSDEPENDKEVDNIQQDYKPTLANPHFGPFPLEPLALVNRETGDSHNQVPAALSRYLPPFQREGIQFLYDAVSEGRGAILGEYPAVFSWLWSLRCEA
jgi:hypothetical protein